MRGEVWTIAASGSMSKPRPAVVVQSDACETANTVVVCPLTTFGNGGFIGPSESNGLAKPSRPMPQQVAAIKRARLGEMVGRLSDDEMELVSDALRDALGL